MAKVLFVGIVFGTALTYLFSKIANELIEYGRKKERESGKK